MMPAKLCFLIIILFTSNLSFSQKNFERYYDINMHEDFAEKARFHSFIKGTDSGWYENRYFITPNILQMAGLYSDKERQIKNGMFYFFYPNGSVKSSGKYINNKKGGLWLEYFSNHFLKDSFNYKAGQPIGISLSWYTNGMIKDSLNMDDKGSGVEVSWFDNGQPSSAGKFSEFKQHGKWQYFHKNGQISSIEIYDHDSLKNKQYFDENGNIADTSSKNREAQFPGGEKGWHKYVSSKLYFPANYELTGHITSLLVSAIVNEEGNIIDAEITVPLHPEFDKIALKAISKSPLWIPAIDHNRKVYYQFTQTFGFSQSLNGQ